MLYPPAPLIPPNNASGSGRVSKEMPNRRASLGCKAVQSAPVSSRKGTNPLSLRSTPGMSRYAPTTGLPMQSNQPEITEGKVAGGGRGTSTDTPNSGPRDFGQNLPDLPPAPSGRLAHPSRPRPIPSDTASTRQHVRCPCGGRLPQRRPTQRGTEPSRLLRRRGVESLSPRMGIGSRIH